MKILLLSPFHGNSSHAAWAEGWQRYSRHEIKIVGLEDKAWAWRLKSSAPTLWQACRTEEADLIVATSLTDLNGFLSLARRQSLARVPVVYYMHENQLTYPIRPGGKRDTQLILRQYHSQLCADEIWFNSQFNLNSWFSQLPKFLERLPQTPDLGLLEELRRRSKVMPVGLELPKRSPSTKKDGEQLLLWNQRWTWEKGSDRFSSLVQKFGEASFRVAILGSSGKADSHRQELSAFLGERLMHTGWVSRQEYLAWLERATVMVSTARHEFFGISPLEAAAYGAITFLPDALAYPELLSAELRVLCLYRSQKELYRKLRDYLARVDEVKKWRLLLQENAYRYSWTELVKSYDEAAKVSVSAT